MDPELKDALETIVARLDEIVDRLGRIEHEVGYPRRREADELERAKGLLGQLESEP
jgi:hypothetical protein